GRLELLGQFGGVGPVEPVHAEGIVRQGPTGGAGGGPTRLGVLRGVFAEDAAQGTHAPPHDLFEGLVEVLERVGGQGRAVGAVPVEIDAHRVGAHLGNAVQRGHEFGEGYAGPDEVPRLEGIELFLVAAAHQGVASDAVLVPFDFDPAGGAQVGGGATHGEGAYHRGQGQGGS